MNRLLILVLAALISATTFAAAQRTTRRGLKPRSADSSVSASTGSDTITAPGTDIIAVTGYDKPLRSSVETFFVTNSTNRRITAIRLELTYTDINGNMLHSRTCDITADIPPQATRQLSIRSWDVQNSFYYRLSAMPRSKVATPYDVSCKVLYILTQPSSTSETPHQ